jgi:hypothetical protein
MCGGVGASGSASSPGGRSVAVATIDGGRVRSASPTRRTTRVDPNVGASLRADASDSR